jgi:hypothetical protein
MLIGQKVHMSFKPLAFSQNVHVVKKDLSINLDHLKNQKFS